MQNLYADVIVDISNEKLDRVFQYQIPQELTEVLKVGMVVMVPFGRGNRMIQGYVVGITQESSYEPERIKFIQEALTDAGDVRSNLIALAWWIRETYGSTMIQALKTVIPIRQKVKPKEKKRVRLLLGGEEAAGKLALFEKKNQKARKRLLEALIQEEEIPYELVTGKLNISAQTLKALEEQKIIGIGTTRIYRNPVKSGIQDKSRMILNPEQKNVTEGILHDWEKNVNPVSLIHGVTGSGKTEVYMELIAHAVSMGQQAIVLIPEIALTYQTVMRFYRRFGDRISILNSRLSAGERYDQSERARMGEIDVMIGPRSALFTPFPNLGMIIIDEEHEGSYKSETVPRYHARETAIYRASLTGARVVLGSATPSVDAYYRARNGEYKLYEMQSRAAMGRMASVFVTDMREELKSGNRSILSRSLQNMIQDRIEKKEQVMLFLNRRGYSGFLSCRSCGSVLQCPHCDVSLSLHRNGKLICHYCGYETVRPDGCPDCGSPFLRGFKAGTQQVEELVQKEFPDARILRMDLDTTREKDGHEKILSAFSEGEADILIGTQMIVKGHDFPNVTLVGILAADLSLHASEYTAGERTFQLLTQAAGRAGRGERSGEVVIQTYDPEHYCIVSAAAQDYKGFYEQEIAFRRIAGYPPAAGLLAVHGACADENYLASAMDYLAKFIQKIAGRTDVRMIGPADENVARIQDVYRKVLYLKEEKKELLIMIKNRVEQYIEANPGFDKTNIQFDLY